MPTIVRYPVDYSGLKANNLVIGEVRDLTGLNKKLVAPEYGAFYENNLVVTDFFSGDELVPRIDYVVAQLEPTATSRSGKSVYQFLLILNPNTTKIRFNYQAVGGEYSLSSDAIAEFVAILEGDTRTIAWGDLIGTPEDFPPSEHMHNAMDDLYGMGDVIASLESMRQAILTGDAAAQEDTINYVINAISAFQRTQFSTTQDAVEGKRTDVAMTPFATNKAIASALSLFSQQGNDLEFSTTLENDSWGYIRDRNTGTTLCFGSSIDLNPEDVYRVNFKRRFNNIPLVISGDVQSTTQTDATGSAWVEVVAKIPQHTIDQSGFIAVGRRLGGGGTDTARLKYLAIGISDSNQPTTYTEGYPTTVPPLPSQALQPVWSGTNNIIAVNSSTTDVKRVGVVFPSTVAGGGYTINTNAATAVANCYYTPYPGSFIDSNYEIMGHVEMPGDEYLLNLNYVGITLDTWHDLSVVKAAAGNTPDAGFVWDATGIYGGQVKLTVTIRNKTQTSKSAVRVFYIGQSSANYDPSAMVTDSANSGLQVINYNTSADVIKPLAISFASGLNVFNSNSFSINNQINGVIYDAPSQYVYYGPPSDPSTVDNNASLYEVKVVAPDLDGFDTVGSEWPFNTWLGLDVLRGSANSNQEFTLDLSGANTALLAPVYVYVRHKYDHVKTAKFTLLVNKIGTGVTPEWLGNSNLLSYPTVAGNKVFNISFTMASPPGIAVAILNAGGNIKSEYLSYTHNVSFWNENEYVVSARVVSSITAAGSFTSTGSPLATFVNTTTANFVWTGSNPTDAHMQLVIEVVIKHKTLSSASATKLFTFDIYGYGYA